MIKRIKIGFATISILTVSLSAIEITSHGEAINIAGKQRMFTQRMLKDYAMIGMKNTFGKPEDDLKKIIHQFDETNTALSEYSKEDAIKKSIKKMVDLWTPLKQILSEEPKVEKASKLQEDLEVLLHTADTTTKLISSESAKEASEIVNMSGRQRMLSQRMAGLYMLKVWGIDDPQFKVKMDETMNLFKTSLVKLEKSELNTDEINKLLAKVKRSFMFFEMMNKSKSKFVPTLIYKKSNDILTNMNSVTQNYVALETK